MAEQTGISWTDATFNPWWGCERVSPACARCYAAGIAARYGHGETWGDGEHPFRFFADEHWAQPLRWARLLPAKLGRRPRVFCASMADVFEERPELEEHRRRLFDLIRETPELDWQILTKRPEFARDWLRGYYYEQGYPREWNGRDWIDWGVLPNVWVGVSVENQRWTWRVDVLRQIPATVRFISAEPLLQSLLSGPTSGESPDAGDALRQRDEGSIPSGSTRKPLDLDGIDWLIVGGESGGRKSRPLHPAWALELRDACVERGIGFHMKQWGSWTPADPRDGGEWRFGDGKPRVWVTPRGNVLENGAPFVPGDAAFMRYAGASPKAGGKMLLGREWCEFPESRALVPA